MTTPAQESSMIELQVPIQSMIHQEVPEPIMPYVEYLRHVLFKNPALQQQLHTTWKLEAELLREAKWVFDRSRDMHPIVKIKES